MHLTSDPVNVLWFKRDLRLNDHEPLALTVRQEQPVILFYAFEPDLIASGVYDLRHWRFVWESIVELNRQLKRHDNILHVLWADPKEVLAAISERFQIKGLYSHQETGLKITFDRDKSVAAWCRKHGVPWHESKSNGVIRALRSREHWLECWAEFINMPLVDVDTSRLKSIDCPDLFNAFKLPQSFKDQLEARNILFQPGGSSKGQAYLASFLSDRHRNYRSFMSKPEASRRSCSRLSPYLAWGCLSVRQVYQEARVKLAEQPGGSSVAEAFLSRLRWQSHFIQKFESECEIEFRDFNAGFCDLRMEWDEDLYQAWANGRTGYPLVDACMRCLHATGWINFRMRAMLVSFLTHHLWLDWRAGARHLGRLFLDFEPGIHYPQFHMQAGTTGVHTFRIYNPERQAVLHDPQAKFIKQWIPELNNLPAALALAPYRISYLEEVFYQFRLGIDYPRPIVDIAQTYQSAREKLWKHQQNNPEVKIEALRILRIHTTPNRTV